MFNTIFSSYLYTNHIECNLNDIKNHILQVQKEDKKGVVVTNKGGWQSKSFFKVTPVVKKLFNTIGLLNQDIKKNINLPQQVELESYWYNINNLCDFNEPHSHINLQTNSSLISGVFYVSTFKNSGNLIFLSESRTTGLLYDKKIDNYNSYTSSNWKIEPKNNLCVLFPSNLLHYVEPNLLKEKRISMSFNYGF